MEDQSCPGRRFRRIFVLFSAISLAAVVATGATKPGAALRSPSAPKPLAARAATAGATTYYIDSESGSDKNTGKSKAKAWRTIARANRATLAPGDRVLFAGGQTFSGTIVLGEAAGLPNKPIVIGSYGQSRALIAASAGDALLLADCAYITVRDLALAGCGRKGGSDGAGVRLARTEHVTIERVEAHGFRIAGIMARGDTDTRIMHVWAHENGFAGIAVDGGHDGFPRSKNLYIGYCRADDNPGDPKNLTSHSGNGIVVGGVDGALIEYCEASDNGWDMPRKGNGPVGIWGWDCDRLVIQRCISHDNKSPGDDGDGFDFDGGVTNSLLQYNLSYNNQGTGYLLCQYPEAPPWHSNVVRFNISINDGAKNFQSGIGLWLGDSGIAGAQVYNNTIINPWHAVVTLGDIPDIVYKNNVFVAGGDLIVGDFAHSRFENNLYHATGPGVFLRNGDTTYETLAEWARATGQETVNGQVAGIVADPRLALPLPGDALPTDPERLHEMAFFRPLSGSPCMGAGAAIANCGEDDFFGDTIDPGDPFLGAGRFADHGTEGAKANPPAALDK